MSSSARTVRTLVLQVVLDDNKSVLEVRASDGDKEVAFPVRTKGGIQNIIDDVTRYWVQTGKVVP